ARQVMNLIIRADPTVGTEWISSGRRTKEDSADVRALLRRHLHGPAGRAAADARADAGAAPPLVGRGGLVVPRRAPRYRRGALPVRLNSYQDFGLMHLCNLFMHEVRGGQRRQFFNWVTGWTILGMGMVGALIGSAPAQPARSSGSSWPRG